MGRAYDPDHWYYFVTCQDCGEVISLAEAPSPEQEPDARCPARQMPCPRCHREGHYVSRQIARRLGETRCYQSSTF